MEKMGERSQRIRSWRLLVFLKTSGDEERHDGHRDLL